MFIPTLPESFGNILQNKSSLPLETDPLSFTDPQLLSKCTKIQKDIQSVTPIIYIHVSNSVKKMEMYKGRLIN